jgi:hypothetical protein
MMAIFHDSDINFKILISNFKLPLSNIFKKRKFFFDSRHLLFFDCGNEDGKVRTAAQLLTSAATATASTTTITCVQSGGSGLCHHHHHCHHHCHHHLESNTLGLGRSKTAQGEVLVTWSSSSSSSSNNNSNSSSSVERLHPCKIFFVASMDDDSINQPHMITGRRSSKSSKTTKIDFGAAGSKSH